MFSPRLQTAARARRVGGIASQPTQGLTCNGIVKSAKKFNHVARLSRHRCDYSESLSREFDQRISGIGNGGTRSNPPSDTRMIGRHRDAACSNLKQHLVVWVGGNQETRSSAYSRRASTFGVFGRAHLQIESAPLSPSHCAALLQRKAGMPAAPCMHVPTAPTLAARRQKGSTI